MKVSFDAQLLLEAQKTGIGWMADRLLREMRRIDPKMDLQLNYFQLRDYKNGTPEAMKEYLDLGFREKRAFCSYSLYKMLWNWIPYPYSSFFGKDSDISFFFNYYIPPGVKGKPVTVFHDMGYKAFPETVRKRTMMMLNANMEKACRRAEKIITVSQFTKDETNKYLGVDPDRMVVMHLGVNHEVFRPGCPKERIDAVRAKYHLPEEYLLYLGTLEPRKNIVRMINAYAKAQAEEPSVPVLVLAGRKGWMYDEIFARVKELKLEEKIIFTGYIDADEPPVLLNGALAFLFPSLYEGFGIPPLEAMACGTPVLTANAASLPEVVGTAGILADPYSEDEIADGILKLCRDRALREKLSKDGIERAAGFTWEKGAEILLDVFASIS
ncbi:MAG: glycosyltransferase family 1 protein [Lachnospiraceae bacterium]|uniref:glycosyltransferase family 4 protein n=1 Tax=Hominifimenecus microfluidus TaxID=2885348 RepID=UPI002F991E3D